MIVARIYGYTDYLDTYDQLKKAGYTLMYPDDTEYDNRWNVIGVSEDIKEFYYHVVYDIEAYDDIIDIPELYQKLIIEHRCKITL